MSTPDAIVGLGSDQLARCEDIDALVAILQDSTSPAKQVQDTVPWFEEGAITEVDRLTFRGYLDKLAFDDPPPCDGSPCFLLLWEHRGRYFARQLTRAEAKRFCQLLIRIVK